MKLVSRTSEDLEICQNSSSHSIEEKNGVVSFRFGTTEVKISENAAQDFLHSLAEFCAQKELADYSGADDSAKESYEAWLGLAGSPNSQSAKQ